MPALKSLSSLFDRLRKQKDAEQRTAAELYASLVVTIADGKEEPSIDEIMPVLADAGKTPEDLERDVSRLVQRREWKTILDRLPQIQSQRQQVVDSLEAAREKFRQQKIEFEASAGRLGSMRDIMTKTYEELDLKGPDWLWESAEFMNRALGEKFGSENPEDVLLKTFDAMKEVVREEDQEFFLKQRKLLEREREGVIQTRKKARGEVPGERPQLKEGIDFEDTHSRPGMDGLPPRNESGAYEGTIKSVTSSISPQALQQAVAAAVQPMLSKFDQMINNGKQQHAQGMREMQQQTAAINRNRPEKQSPLAKHSRENRGGYA